MQQAQEEVTLTDTDDHVGKLYADSCDMERLCSELINHFRSLMIIKTVKNPQKLIVCTDKDFEQDFTVNSVYYISEGATKDRTNIYLKEPIELYSVPVETQPQYLPGVGSEFIISPSHTEAKDKFKIGDYIRVLGVKSDETGYISVAFDYTIIDLKYNEITGTSIIVKNRVPANITFKQIVEAGYTSLRSHRNNSFVINGDVTSFFPKDSLIKAYTTDDSQMTYSVVDSFYQKEPYKQTYVTVKQDVAQSVEYTHIAPAWKGTEDGEILWKIIEDPTSITYGWNSYNDIKYRTIISH